MIANVIEYLITSAMKHPDKIAFKDKKRTITFAELNKESKLLGAEIAVALNGRSQQPIAVYLSKSVECIIAFMAVAYSGNFYTPIDTSIPKIRFSKILDTLMPIAFISDSAHNAIISEVSPNTIVFDVNAERTMTSEGALLLEQIQNYSIDTDLLYVMFTSGSTGTPKGVTISHCSVVDYTDWLSDTFHFDEHTVFGNQAPFHFDNSVLDIYSTIKNSCTTVIIPEDKFLSPTQLCHYLDEQKINTIFWVPSELVLVANSGALINSCPQYLDKILFCGEVMPTKQFNIWRRAIPDALYANLYGPTEITDVCAFYLVNREFHDDECLPIGFPAKIPAF